MPTTHSRIQQYINNPAYFWRQQTSTSYSDLSWSNTIGPINVITVLIYAQQVGEVVKLPVTRLCGSDANFIDVILSRHKSLKSSHRQILYSTNMKFSEYDNIKAPKWYIGIAYQS